MSKTTYTIKATHTGERYFESEDENGVSAQPPGFRLVFSPGRTEVDEQGNRLQRAQSLPLGTKVTLELPAKEEAAKLEPLSAASGLQSRDGTLENAYDQLRGLLGDSIEPLEAAQLVEEYRDFWRPKEVKVILLVGSHARTSIEDMRLQFEPLM